MARLEVQVEKESTVDAVLELSIDEQLDLYGVDTKGLVNKPQLQRALIKVTQPVRPVLKTKEEWLLKSKQLEAAHAEADRQLKDRELEVHVESLKLKQAEQERQDELASEKQERLDRLAAEEKERSDKLEHQEWRRLQWIGLRKKRRTIWL